MDERSAYVPRATYDPYTRSTSYLPIHHLMECRRIYQSTTLLEPAATTLSSERTRSGILMIVICALLEYS